MNKVGSYSSLQSQFLENTVKNQKNRQNKSEKTGRKDNAVGVKKSGSGLSERAKELLEELKKKYKNMDFIVADFNSDEEAQKYLSRGTKEYSVLIDPEELEKMAEDSDYKQKNLAIIEDSTSKLKDMAGRLGDKEDEVVSLGVSIGKDGTVSYFAELEKMSEKQMEHIEKTREAKKEEELKAAKDEMAAARQEHLEKSSGKRAVVTADSVEELLEKIKEFDWNNVKEEQGIDIGSRFDYSI